MKNKKHIMVCASRFLASLEMTARQKERKKRFSAAKPPKNAPLYHMSRVIPNAVRNLLKPLQVDYFTSLSRRAENKGIRENLQMRSFSTKGIREN